MIQLRGQNPAVRRESDRSAGRADSSARTREGRTVVYDWRVQLRADRALRLAWVGIIVSLALGGLYRSFLCLFNAFVFGPLLGGLTYPLVAVLPGTADATLMPVLFAEAMGGI